jgi:hypothetical protein
MTFFSFTVEVTQESIVKQYLSLNCIKETKKSIINFSGKFPPLKKYNYPVITFFVQVNDEYQLRLLKSFLSSLKEASVFNVFNDTKQPLKLYYLYNPVWIILLILIDIMLLMNVIRYNDFEVLWFILPSIAYFIIYCLRSIGWSGYGKKN